MPTISVNGKSELSFTRTTDTNVAGGGREQKSFVTGISLDANSTPPVTEGGFCQVAMTAGAGTIDLTNLTADTGRVFSLSGLKVRGLRVVALPGNAGEVTIKKGAANGFTGLGSTFSQGLQPGQSYAFEDTAAKGVQAVDATHKTLDLSGTLTDGVQFVIVGGA